MRNDKPLSTREMSELHRSRIKTSLIINRLQDHHLGTLIDQRTKKPVELTASQIKAGEILLRKTLPDLKQVEFHGAGQDGALIVQIVQYASNPVA